MQFRIRSLWLLVSICCVAAFLYGRYRDYINLQLPILPVFVTSEIDNSYRHTKEFIEKNHPPKTENYWQERLDHVKPKMTVNALFKYVPSTGPSYSFLRPDMTQTFFYPVDAKFGVACIVSVTDKTIRVVKTHGVFEHSMAIDEYGGIDTEKIPGLEEFLLK